MRSHQLACRRLQEPEILQKVAWTILSVMWSRSRALEQKPGVVPAGRQEAKLSEATGEGEGEVVFSKLA